MSKFDLSSIAGFEVRTRAIPSVDSVVHEHELLNQLYISRGIQTSSQLDTSLTNLLPFNVLKGINEAVHLLSVAREQRGRVLVIGDYDTDGATSTALAMLGLREMGLDVDYLLPNRFEYGYGLSPEIVDLALTLNPDLIVTVDNGIASIDGVAKAKAAGVKVLVTDHHLAANVLPNADAIVNPNQPDCSFPSKAACGCTVFYYVLIALRAELRRQGEMELPNLGQWLDLVALATIADVVPLDDNNRRLVQQGLNRVRAGYCRPGIKALFEVAGRRWQEATASDFGFIVGPRLNAAGRLDDMTLGVQLLLTHSDVEAKALAAQLNDLNAERRQIEASMLYDVERFKPDPADFQDVYGAVITGDQWHEGVIGIVASRIKDKIHKPVIAFAESADGTLKGSARSVAGVHLRDCLDWVSKQQPHLILKFGGHAMAAGLTIPLDAIDEFKHWFSESVRVFSEVDALTPHIWTDGELPGQNIILQNALLIEAAGPWGQLFPEPCFVGQWPVHSSRVLADKHLKMSLVVSGSMIDAIAFNVPSDQLKVDIRFVKGVYQLSCNRFRGQETVQLMFSKIETFTD